MCVKILADDVILATHLHSDPFACSRGCGPWNLISYTAPHPSLADEHVFSIALI